MFIQSPLGVGIHFQKFVADTEFAIFAIFLFFGYHYYMSPTQLIEKLKTVQPEKIGKNPVVVLPLKVWREIEDRLEDLEMANSKAFQKRIMKARKEKKLYSFAEAKKKLGL